MRHSWSLGLCLCVALVACAGEAASTTTQSIVTDASNEPGPDTSQPTGQEPLGQPDLEVRDVLIGFAQGTKSFDQLPLADEVMLGLGNTGLLTVDGPDLASASAWIIRDTPFAESEGPFDILGPLRAEGIPQVYVAPRPHCAGPPLEFGPQWDQGRHLVIEPTDFDSCLMWFAVHLLVNGLGQIEAVSLDLFGP